MLNPRFRKVIVRAGVLLPVIAVMAVLAGCPGKAPEPGTEATPGAQQPSMDTTGGPPMPAGYQLPKDALAPLEEPVRGGRRVGQLDAKPGNFNPIIGSSVYESAVDAFLFETLLERDPQTDEWVGRLAQAWEVSEDGLTIKITLRDGLTWSDGEPLTTQDVKFSFDKIKDPAVDAANLRNYLLDLQTVEITGQREVTFTFSEKYFRSLIMVGLIEIIPSHVFAEGDFNKHPANFQPVGSGPYVLESYNESEVRLTANPNWWGREDDYFGRLYNFEDIVLKVITDQTAALATLKSEQIDSLGLTAKQWTRETGGKKFHSAYNKYLEYPKYGTGYSYIGWNATKERGLPFQDKRVRQAMSHFVNREFILKNLYFDIARSVTGPFSPDDPRTPKDIVPPAYDPEVAVALLKEAGWEDHDGDGQLDKGGKPFQFDMLVPQGSENGLKITQILQDELKKHGITLEIRQLEWTVFLEKLNDNAYDASILGWGSSIDSDPYQIWHSSQQEEHGSNRIGFANDRVDELLEEARRTMDREKRNEMYTEFAHILHEEQPYTFLLTQPSLSAVAKKFRNVRTFPLGMETSYWFLP